MATWARLQREFAEQMAAWAERYRQFADTMAVLLTPLPETFHRAARFLGRSRTTIHSRRMGDRRGSNCGTFSMIDKEVASTSH